MGAIHVARALLVGAAATAWALPAAAQKSWGIQVPETVSFHGVASFDAAGGGTAALLYPAPGLAGFLAAVATHGLIVDGVKRSERNKIQEKADEVLSPLRPVLDTLAAHTLVEIGAARLTSPGDKRVLMPPADVDVDWIVETIPAFAMTQDRRALVLDNGITIYSPNNREKPAYRNVVRVVSSPLPEGDAQAHWIEAEGKPLRELAAVIWAESVDIAIAGMAATPAEVAARTVRYPEGGNERIERAEVLSERCDRLLIRTLRGELMSVPARAANACANR